MGYGLIIRFQVHWESFSLVYKWKECKYTWYKVKSPFPWSNSKWPSGTTKCRFLFMVHMEPAGRCSIRQSLIYGHCVQEAWDFISWHPGFSSCDGIKLASNLCLVLKANRNLKSGNAVFDRANCLQILSQHVKDNFWRLSTTPFWSQ